MRAAHGAQEELHGNRQVPPRRGEGASRVALPPPPLRAAASLTLLSFLPERDGGQLCLSHLGVSGCSSRRRPAALNIRTHFGSLVWFVQEKRLQCCQQDERRHASGEHVRFHGEVEPPAASCSENGETKTLLCFQESQRTRNSPAPRPTEGFPGRFFSG